MASSRRILGISLSWWDAEKFLNYTILSIPWKVELLNQIFHLLPQVVRNIQPGNNLNHVHSIPFFINSEGRRNIMIILDLIVLRLSLLDGPSVLYFIF